jgi:hypothetical protein
MSTLLLFMTNLQSEARLGSFGSACLDTHAQLEVGDHHSDPPGAKPLENSAGVTCQLLSIHPVSYYGAQPGFPRCVCVRVFLIFVKSKGLSY